ncbi:MAG: branched-chain amino acid ABC transporter permease, partial [Mycobacteriales bacterium]
AAIALFTFLLIYRRLDEIGAGNTGGVSGLVTGILGRRRRRGPLGPTGAVLATVALLAVPLLAGGTDLRTAQEALALFVAFLAITAITGFAGYITLGTAGFAGLGALVSAKTAAGTMPGLPRLPALAAMLVAALVCSAVGFVAGYPALRRRGLILGLITLAVNLILYKLVFGQVYFEHGTVPARPRPFGLSGDRVFFCFELAVAAGAVFLTHNLRSGRLGRILAAIRDSETGAQSVGISLRRYKLFIFSVSAGLAGIGGALLTQQSRAFNPDDFQPLYSLFWFTAVVVAGLSYVSGAALAAGLYVGLDALLGRPGASQIVIGLGALAIGFLPGGIVGVISRARRRGFVPGSLYARFLAAREGARSPALPLPALTSPGVVLAPPEATGGPVEVLVPSGFARRVTSGRRP